MKIRTLLLLTLFCSTGANADTCYIADDAIGTWGTGSGECCEAAAAGESNPCSAMDARTSAVAGDTIIMLNINGDFSENSSGLIGGASTSRAAAGTIGNIITYEGKAGTTVTIAEASGMAINVEDLSYITIKNLTIESGYNHAVAIENSDNIIIEDCHITSTGTGTPFALVYGIGPITNFIFRDNIVDGISNYSHADMFYMVASSGNNISNILIEGNTVDGGLHAAMELQPSTGTFQNVTIRNNTIRSQVHMGLNVYDGVNNVLIEGNISYGNGSLCVADGCMSSGDKIYEGMTDEDANRPMEQHPALVAVGNNHIIRYNTFHSSGSGIQSTSTADTTNQRMYNNTLYNNGLGYWTDGSTGETDEIYFKNNIFANHTNTVGTSRATPRPLGMARNENTLCDYLFDTNNFFETNDPQFTTCEHAGGVDTVSDLEGLFNDWVASNTLSDPKFITPGSNFNLQTDSPAINAGTHLTTVAVADTGTGTTIEVADSKYFSDATYAPVGEIDADYICIGTTVVTSVCVQISSIPDADTVVLNSSIPRSDGDFIWLQKDSDGTTVLYGSAPDMGAYEYIYGVNWSGLGTWQ